MLVSTEWLGEHLDDPNLVVVDMRWRDDGSGPDRYAAGHVPGAVHVDWTVDIAETRDGIAFMLAGPERFAAAMEQAGIGDETTVVAYADEHGSGPFRLWWAFRVHGHDGVRILDGGFAKWVAEGRATTAEAAIPAAGVRWTPRPGSVRPATAKDVVAARGSGAVLDSRPPEQFRGEAVWFERGAVAAGPDGVAHTPRGPLRAGRVPWASNVPADSLYRPDGTLKPAEELRAMFLAAGADPESPSVTYCGVGISAAALVYALDLAGFAANLYDGSWDEWGRSEQAVARG